MNCDPQYLMDQARCFKCIPTGLQRAVIVNLVQQWANAPTNLFAWTPATAQAHWQDSAGVHSGDLADFYATPTWPSTIELNFDIDPITSLTGLADLPGLLSLLAGGGTNVIPSIDLSGNPLMQQLDCNTCQTAFLDISGSIAWTLIDCGNNLLTGTLDCSGFTNLLVLVCANNAITGLTLIGCTALVNLDCNACALTELDASTCIALNVLNCTANSIGPPNGLDISGCTLLTQLYCGSNLLTELDVTPCTVLELLYCQTNALVTGGNTLDVHLCTALQEIFCNNNSLSSLDVRLCVPIAAIDCSSNTGLTSLLIAGTSSSLNYVNCDNCNIPTAGAGGIDDIWNKVASSAVIGPFVNGVLAGNVPATNGPLTNGILNADYLTLDGLGWNQSFN